MFIFGEHNIVLKYWDLLYSAYFWFLMMIAGILGFLIGALALSASCQLVCSCIQSRRV